MSSAVKVADISICVANFNGKDILGSCLDSIVSQETSAQFEVLVHDDASTDGTLEGILLKYPEIVVIRSNKNVGYCVANHRMAEKAVGKQLLLLNNDAELMPGALEALYVGSLKTPECILSLAEYTMDGELSCRGMGLDIFFTPYHCRGSGDRVVYAMGACLLISKNLWLELGGYPVLFGYSGEDLYLCLKARARGVSTEILQKSGYRHHISKSTNVGGISLERRRFSERNRHYIINRMLRRRERLVVWPLFQLMSVAEMLFHAVRTQSFSPLIPLALPEGVEDGNVSVLSMLGFRATKLNYLLRRGNDHSHV